MKNPAEQFSKASNLMYEGKLEKALGMFLEMEGNPGLAPFCYYRIAQISNMIGEPEEAYDLYYKAFTAMPNITSRMYNEEHSNYGYVFKGMKEEKRNTKCPICGKESTPRWCYALADTVGYNDFFNPVRMWMYCEPCNHMFARDFPERLFIYNDTPRSANSAYFAYYSEILATIRRFGYASGMTLFEIGIGA